MDTKRVRVVLSMPSLISVGTWRWNLSQFIDTAVECGYDGIQFTPVRLPRVVGQIMGGKMKPEELAAIVCGESTFVVHSRPWQSITDPNLIGMSSRVIDFLGYLLFPHQDDFEQFERLREMKGEFFPLTLYPRARSLMQQTAINWPQMLFQPSVSARNYSKQTSVKGMVDVWLNRGFTGLTLDILHLQELVGVAEMRSSSLLLLPLAQVVHIPLNRPDASEYSQLVARDLLAGTNDSDVWNVLQILRGNRWRGIIVIERGPEYFGKPKDLIPKIQMVAKILRSFLDQ